jgi:hypothetical protein
MIRTRTAWSAARARTVWSAARIPAREPDRHRVHGDRAVTGGGDRMTRTRTAPSTTRQAPVEVTA